MKQVWKCDFCCDTDESKDAIIKHEATCSFNPSAKRCYTCKHQTEEGAPISGFWNECDKKLDIETDNTCVGWELDETKL